MAADPAPVGEVLGAVGYHYEQWAQVSAYAQGVGVRTRDNPDFTMLDDETLRPRWSVEVDTKQSTYDASDRRYLVATLLSDTSPDLVSLDADTGRRVWCVPLGGDTVRPNDPFATQVLDDEDVAVLARAKGRRSASSDCPHGTGPSSGSARSMPAPATSSATWATGMLLAGGREQFRLFDPASLEKRKEGTSFVMLSARDGSTIWSRTAPDASDAHVVGTDPATGLAVLQEWRAQRGRAELRTINRQGDQEWYAVPAGGAPFDAALRSGRVLVRSGDQWSAYDVESGRRLWRRNVPAEPQFLPYGFELDSIPMLDPDHALIGGTTALHTLDLRTGTMTSAPLPTDGINTTYWPYQVAVTDRLIAVATNTGAVVVRRE